MYLELIFANSPIYYMSRRRIFFRFVNNITEILLYKFIVKMIPDLEKQIAMIYTEGKA